MLERILDKRGQFSKIPKIMFSFTRSRSRLRIKISGAGAAQKQAGSETLPVTTWIQWNISLGPDPGDRDMDPVDPDQ